MEINKLLGCIGLSLAIHAVFFISLPQQTLRHILPKRPIEVSYQQAVVKKKVEVGQDIRTSPMIEETKAQPPLLKQNEIASDLIKNEIFRDKPSMDIGSKPLITDDPSALKKTVSLSNIPGETFKTPEYRSYYQIVREKIRRLAYYNYKKLERGEVFLTFALTAKGDLLDVSINEQRSSPSSYLRDIALKSIQEAMPYPEFPEKLKKNSKLTFNVIISFELK